MHDRRDVVVLTAASGFIGRALIKRLAPRYRLVAIDRPGGHDPVAPALPIDFDLARDDNVQYALSRLWLAVGHRIASVVHLATDSDNSGAPNPLHEQITVQGARRLIEGLQGFDVEQFVYASSMLVHAPTRTPDGRINEASPPSARRAFPESMLRAEAVLRKHRGHIPLAALRIAHVYDATGYPPILVEQIARVYEGRPLVHVDPDVFGVHAAVHVDDVAGAIQRVIERRQTLAPDVAILVDEEDALRIDEVEDIVGRVLHERDRATGDAPPQRVLAGSGRHHDPSGNRDLVQPWMIEEPGGQSLMNTSRARALLGWAPAHSLRATLPEIVQRLKLDPPAWYRANGLDPARLASHVDVTNTSCAAAEGGVASHGAKPAGAHRVVRVTAGPSQPNVSVAPAGGTAAFATRRLGTNHQRGERRCSRLPRDRCRPRGVDGGHLPRALQATIHRD